METGKIGTFDKVVFLIIFLVSFIISPILSGFTLSILVIAIAPLLIPKRFSISKCSNVCGINPSSAAIIKRQNSTPITPESIF